MKLFAYYLPQYHCIPENDEWWGKGFTEWVNVKKAKPLYKNHMQPKVPLNNNYYSLDNVETLKWQEELLNKYKVDGLIFYHYYFAGKKLLEKPAEMLLKNQNININFFFCWANHSWYRSWEGSKQMLQEQIYGEEKEWEDHFNYLLPFFKDKRYQKHNNKPIMLLFNSSFKEKNRMFDFLNKKCIENGFNGICLIETQQDLNRKRINYSEITKETEYIHLREPSSALVYMSKQFCYIPLKVYNKMKKIIGKESNSITLKKKYNGDMLLKIMTKNYFNDKRIIRGLFFEWDNTPRHGKRGYVITPPKKESFFKYMEKIKNDEYVFINAWNEWCEGMMLEPTEENGYKYLEWIKEWKENENRSNGV